MDYLKNRNLTKYILALSVAMLTVIVYLPALQNNFVTWDDPDYVYENPNIRSFDAKFIKWAFLKFYFAYWHPLTTVSYALDYAIWGLNPFGYHLTNVVLHGLNAFLVVILVMRLMDIGLLRRKTGNYSEKISTTAGVATGILFGLHPIHVESVAWISERKDVLCAFFFLSSLLAYIKYATAEKKDDSVIPFENKKYLFTLLLFVLSLLSKPMAVTLPIVLLILDWFPLGRLEKHTFNKVSMEKLPFIFLSFGVSIIIYWAQLSGGAVTSLTVVPLFPRILVGLKAVVGYLEKMLLPVNLIPFYPYPEGHAITLSSYEYFVPLLLFAGITAACFIVAYTKRKKIWLALWLYYIVTLLPVLGIVKVGAQAMADRYTYLPSLGPFFLLGLAMSLIRDKLTSSNDYRIVKRAVFAVIGGLVIISLSHVTLEQIHIWKNGATLWGKEIEIEPGVELAYSNRGKYYTEVALFDKALTDFNQAVLLNPRSPKNYYNRGSCYMKLRLYEDARRDLTQAIFLSPVPMFEYYNNRAIVYAKMGYLQEALADYTQAINLKPGEADPYYNRGNAYARTGFYQAALSDYTRAIELSPSPNSDYYNNRGVIYKRLGRFEEAFRDLSQAQLLRNRTP
jgi:protein O-mannosyl-transferase